MERDLLPEFPEFIDPLQQSWIEYFRDFVEKLAKPPSSPEDLGKSWEEHRNQEKQE